MTEEEFTLLKKKLLIWDDEIFVNEVEFRETHISYLVLLPDFVYKIKKSVKFPFLDFSALDQRKRACTQELLLNQRTAPSMYLDIHEIKKVENGVSIGGMKGKTIDYAVRMKRVDNLLEMDQMLEGGKVRPEHMERLSSQIAQFHQKTFAVRKVWDIQELKETYNQLQEWSERAGKVLGKGYQQIIQDSCRLSDHFLENHIDLMNRRSQKGLVRDVHGDLHSRNIFLEDPPVIFDCIEFDDDLRQIDLLNEIAFFIIDLEFYGADKLAQHFYNHYMRLMKSAGMKELEDAPCLNYFKMYRASVKAKVTFISLDKLEEEGKRQTLIKDIKRYLDLVKHYAASLK